MSVLEKLRNENTQLRREVAELKNRISILESSQKDPDTLREHVQELEDSISYAQRIQGAIMPPVERIKHHLPESFILYLPRDVVSGDFYFFEPDGDKMVVAAVDCTGHGVPGALMSVVGFNYLQQAVKERHLFQPNEILSYLDEGVNDRLRQTGNESGVKDGMDLSLCVIEPEQYLVRYAGAYNPLYIVSKNSCLIKKCKAAGYRIHTSETNPEIHLIEIQADKFPIGVNIDGVVDIYTNHELKMQKGDCIYLFSDGYADQFGGPRGKKMKYKRLRELLINGHDQPMIRQKEYLAEAFRDWQGDLEQVDDVLVIGIRL